MRSLLLFAVAACSKFDAPVFEEPTIQVILGDEFETTVIGTGTPGIPQFRMHFPGGPDIVHLPDRFEIGGQNVLAAAPNCTNEAQIGIGVFPAVTAAAAVSGGTPTPGDDNGTPNFVSIDVQGPHLARIVVGYSVDYTCLGQQQLSGETTFVIFPTGRIVRADRRVRPSTLILGDTSSCGCPTPAGDAQKVFSTYWSFVPAGANVNRVIDPVPDGSGSDGACTIFGSSAVGVQFSQPTSRVRHNTTVSAHVFDFFNGIGDLNQGEQTMFSAVQVEPTASSGATTARCAGMLDRLVDGPILIGDRSYNSTNEDGIYVDDVGVRSDSFVIRPPAGGSLAAGFTVTFELDGGNARITRVPGPSVEPVAYLQREFPGSQRFFAVFNEGLADGESITIEPQ